MALTLMQLVDYAVSVMSENHDPRWDEKAMCNQAGHYLFSMHPWRWRQRPSVTLTLDANQTYVDLPVGIDHVLSVQAADSAGRDAYLTTPEAIDDLRATSATGAGTSFWVALEYANQPDSNSPPRGPRLALFPAASSGDQIVVNGRNGWTDLVLMQQVANVPANMEALLIELVRAFARAAANPAVSIPEAVEPIERSVMLERLKRNDSLAQANLGQMEGGIMGRRGGTNYRGWYDPAADIAITSV